MSEQYIGRTEADWAELGKRKDVKPVFDGLPVSLSFHDSIGSQNYPKPHYCHNYQVQTQTMVRALPIHKRNDTARHEAVNEISYTEEDRYDFPPVEGVEREEKKERAGVVRLVHGWTQKLQKEKVSPCCFCRSSTPIYYFY